ncbi:hypothetical protein QFC22_003260 [Naganishia vaughanmartiniae]|uniref:Uncharacterized protein n=1 Tax=Naganishia vaughanmartiniae TaxID=1424756 RepID=A0ACC2X7Y7_9TREE|nr:hypothetical protein QFC22_003260 [Naganishia vaughanmartiniae]
MTSTLLDTQPSYYNNTVLHDEKQSHEHIVANADAQSFHSLEGVDSRKLEKVSSPMSDLKHLQDRETFNAATLEKDAKERPIVAGQQGDDVDRGYLHGVQLWLVYIAMLLCIFLVSLDFTILGPSLGKISDRFDALQQIGWIASAFFLSQAPLTLMYGQILTIARAKNVLLVTVGIFELGSLLCAVAPNVEVLIFGRAVAGVGGGGIFIGVINMIAQSVPLRLRSALMGGFGAVYGVSSLLGPLLGGAFTDSKVTWRACFWINLPIGLIACIVIFFFVKSKPSHAEIDPEDNRTTLERWRSLDWIGLILLLGVTTCLILALSWGGNTRPWNDAGVIACFCVFGVMLPIFILWSRHMGMRAVLPLQFLKDRAPLVILPTILIPIGGGLFQTITASTSSAKLAGFQILVGAGCGFAIQSPLIALNAIYHDRPGLLPQGECNTAGPRKDIAEADFLLGSVIGISISQVIFTNGLQKYIKPLGLSEEMIQSIRSSVEIVKTLPADVREDVIVAYVKSLRDVYIMAIPAGILCGLSAILIKRLNIKKMGIKIGAPAA